ALSLAARSAFGVVARAQPRAAMAPEAYAQLKFRYIGPVGNRVIAVAGVPGDPNVYYVGAASGGIFKTTDNGAHWDPIFDGEAVSSIGSLAVAPSDPNVVWVGTGESFIRSNISIGNGIYKSTDAGKNWTHAGLDATGRIGRVVIDPRNPDVVVACALGHAYGPQQERGVYRTADGTKTQSGSLWRTDNGGDDWEMISADRRLRGRTHYYTRFAVEPDNENEAYFLSAEFTKTLDGGKTSIDLSGRLAPIGDNHDMWIDPANGDRMVVAHDDGLSFSVNRGRSWHHLQLPVAQMYHVATDNHVPYHVYGNRQDGPSTRGPSNSRLGKPSEDAEAGPIPRGMWHSVAGGESGWAIPDPLDNNIIWATGTGYGSLGGTVERYDERTRQAREVEVWPEVTVGTPAGAVKYRFNWTFPIAISPHDHNTIYAGSQHLHRTANGGQSWQVISPDLTTGDKTK